VTLFDDKGEWGVQKYPEYPSKKDFLFMLPFKHGALAFRKDALTGAGCYISSKATRRTEDYELLMRMYARDCKGHNIQNNLYNYREDVKAHKKRKYSHKLDEAKIRYKGFRALGLMPRGMIYVIKPLLVGLIPYRLLEFLKDKYHGRRG